MTYNVLIADDEYFIRQRLKKIINWEELNLNFIGEAENGQQVMERLSEHSVDILLLDIKMPIQNGIDVMEYIVANDLSTRVIILSGYNDFDYVQKALRLKAEDYLVKPIKKEALRQSLIACQEQLNTSNQKQQELNDYQQQQIEVKLYQLLTSKDAEDQKSYLPNSIHSNNYFVLIGIYREENLEAFIDSMKERLSSHDYYMLSFKESENESVIYAAYNNQESYNIILSSCQLIHEQTSGYTFLTITQQISFHDKEWYNYYEQVRRGLDQRYFTSSEQVYLAPLAATKAFKYPDSLHDQFKLFLKTHNLEELETYISKVFHQIKKVGTRCYLGLALTEIYVILHMNHPEHFQKIPHLNQHIEMFIDENHDLNTLKEYVMEDITNCLRTSGGTHSSLIDNITQYLNEHYMEPTLSVADLSDHFYRNANYIGSIFKKHTGQSIVQYITHLRMNKAKALLSTKQYNITEIAAMVGYTDVFYFSRKFKKLFGCSPKNY